MEEAISVISTKLQSQSRTVSYRAYQLGPITVRNDMHASYTFSSSFPTLMPSVFFVRSSPSIFAHRLPFRLLTRILILLFVLYKPYSAIQIYIIFLTDLQTPRNSS